jgi:hypothetical protein
VRRLQRGIAVVLAMVLLLSAAFVVAPHVSTGASGDVFIARERNFYGVSRVFQRASGDARFGRVVMTHGNTSHGFQYLNPAKRAEPTMYYARESGVGLAIANHPARKQTSMPLRIGVVGLGAGTLACYAGPGDYLRFYEIDPLVVHLSQEHFTFQSDARQRGADVDVFVGDARLVMERQLARGEAKQFDVLVIDAFSSDAIPVHLLTKECFAIYLAHLKSTGVLAIHISNRHLDLGPVVRTLAENAGQSALLINRELNRELLRQGGDLATGSEWVLITCDEQILANAVLRAAATPWPKHARSATWTDDYSSLFTLLRRD